MDFTIFPSHLECLRRNICGKKIHFKIDSCQFLPQGYGNTATTGADIHNSQLVSPCKMGRNKLNRPLHQNLCVGLWNQNRLINKKIPAVKFLPTNNICHGESGTTPFYRRQEFLNLVRLRRFIGMGQDKGTTASQHIRQDTVAIKRRRLNQRQQRSTPN